MKKKKKERIKIQFAVFKCTPCLADSPECQKNHAWLAPYNQAVLETTLTQQKQKVAS